MKAVGQSNINWSEIARPHFEAACALRERGVRSETVKRLRLSKLLAEQKLEAQGRIDGRVWVDGTDEYEGNAEYEPLKRLQTNAGQYRSARDRSWEQLRSAVDPLEQCSDEEVYRHLFGEDPRKYRDHSSYLTGFIEARLRHGSSWRQRLRPNAWRRTPLRRPPRRRRR